MAKKSKKTRNEDQENASETQSADLTEATQAGSEANASKTDIQADAVDQAGAAPESAHEESVDDLMEDVRRSLMEEESESRDKKGHWWNRITKGLQRDQSATEIVETPAEVPPVEEPQKEDEYLEQIDELIDMLDSEAETPVAEKSAEVKVEAPMEPAISTEPEKPVDLEELKKRVFNQHEPAAIQEESEVRTIALEGGEDVFVEVEARREDASQDRIKAFENSLRPYMRYIYWVTAFVGVLMVVAVSAVLVRVYQQSRPLQPTQAVSNLPYPNVMILPGGLSFNLGKGAIKDGKWDPRGAEWLEGTEICRWVAIPWSLQLEAVVRTLTQKDTIELVMSNNDKLTYNVYSIQQLTLEEMQALDQNTPCLLLVLAKQDSEKRWVVTAKP